MKHKIQYIYKTPVDYWNVLRDIPEPTEKDDDENIVYVVMADHVPWTTMTIIYGVYKHYTDARNRLDKEVQFRDSYLISRVYDYLDLGFREGDRYQVDSINESGHRIRYRIKKCHVY